MKFYILLVLISYAIYVFWESFCDADVLGLEKDTWSSYTGSVCYREGMSFLSHKLCYYDCWLSPVNSFVALFEQASIFFVTWAGWVEIKSIRRRQVKARYIKEFLRQLEWLSSS